MCSIGGSGSVQLKHLFSHHFFTYSMKMRLGKSLGSGEKINGL